MLGQQTLSAEHIYILVLLPWIAAESIETLTYVTPTWISVDFVTASANFDDNPAHFDFVARLSDDVMYMSF